MDSMFACMQSYIYSRKRSRIGIPSKLWKDSKIEFQNQAEALQHRLGEQNCTQGCFEFRRRYFMPLIFHTN